MARPEDGRGGSTDPPAPRRVEQVRRVGRVRMRFVARSAPLDELGVWIPLMLVGAAIGALARLL